MTSSTSFRERFAGRLEAKADVIADAWLGRVREGGGPADGELRDRVSGLMADLAEVLRETEDSEDAVLLSDRAERVRECVDLRRGRGGSLPRLLGELGLLQTALDDEAGELIAAVTGASPLEVHAVHRVLHRTFGEIGRDAARAWDGGERRERSELTERFAGFSRALQHEMRDPLQIALGTVDLLASAAGDESSESRHSHLRVLKSQLERMAELLTEARRLTASEESPGEARWVPVRELVEGVFEELGAMAESKGVDLRAGHFPDDAERVSVPRVRLALRNLVANAIKYSDPEEADPHVEVSLRRTPEGGRRLVVEDNGLGVPEDVGEKIFEPGVRAHPDVGSGAGLGLAIVRELVETRGGSVSVEPVVEGGTRFVLDLSAALASGSTS